MRQHVTPQELDEHFMVLLQERALFAQKSPAQRLGCAILLKYFQWEGRFPTAWHDVPRAVIRHVAERLGVPVDSARQYDLEGRLARYHKEQIRQWMGFRPGTAADAEAIKAWVCAHTRIDEGAVPQLLSRLTDRYKQLKIELPTPSRLERLAPSPNISDRDATASPPKPIDKRWSNASKAGKRSQGSRQRRQR